ncbi:MAG: glycosyltransferase, exosortase A system-associated [Gammaproteobacteria bacterium]|nr:glycosyltransferase, exosortase A system-associated [Gammaproteobacteria bacterium]
MKILHIFDHSIPLHSGYTFRSMSILKEQAKLGWKTYHITSPKHTMGDQKANLSSQEEVDGLLFYRSQPLKRWQIKLPILNHWFVVQNLKKRLKEIIKEIKPDILHAHSPALNGLAAISIGKLFNIPVVYEIRAFWEDAAVDHGTSSEQGFRYKLTKALETYVVKKADAVTTICEGLKKDIIDRGIMPEKLTVIPNAVNIDKFQVIAEKNSTLAKQYNLDGNKVIGFIGSFYAYEGLPSILKAYAKLKSALPNVKVFFVGGGPDEEKLKRLAKELNIEDDVIFAGRVPHDQVNDYYSLIDVLIYPRVSMRLTELVTPLKPLEAMAQKRLFVASNVGGHKELIKHSETGFLYKHDDIDDLKNILVDILKQLDKYQLIKDNGRNYVENERNWTKSVSNYIKLYNNLTL